MTNPACRVAPIENLDQLSAQQEKLRARLGRRGAAPKNIYRTLLRFPDFLEAMLPLGARAADVSGLSAPLREIVILRTAWRCDAEYEWAQHVEIARRAGLNEAQIVRIALDPLSPSWNAAEHVVLKAVDNLFDSHMLSNETWQSLRQQFDETTIVDLIATCGFYNMLAWQLGSLGVQIEDGRPGYSAELRAFRRAG